MTMLQDVRGLRVLVVGGGGFIGQQLVARLCALGASVAIATRSIPTGATQPQYDSFHVPNQTLEEWVIATASADVVVHVAHGGTPASANADMEEDLRRSVVPLFSLLRACEINRVRRLVFASSGGTVYGSQPTRAPISEDAPTDPVSAYGVNKLVSEKYINLIAARIGLEVRILRLSNPYGPSQQSKTGFGVIPTFAKAILSGSPITLIGDGTAVRDYVFISDVIEAFVLACVDENSTRCLNIGSGIGVSLNELIAELSAACRREPEILFLPARSFDVTYSVLDIARARQSLGWQPKIPLREGLEATIASWDA